MWSEDSTDPTQSEKDGAKRWWPWIVIIAVLLLLLAVVGLFNHWVIAPNYTPAQLAAAGGWVSGIGSVTAVTVALVQTWFARRDAAATKDNAAEELRVAEQRHTRELAQAKAAVDASRVFHEEQMAVSQHNRQVDALKAIARHVAKANAVTLDYTLDYLRRAGENGGAALNGEQPRLASYLSTFEYHKTLASIALPHFNDRHLVEYTLEAMEASEHAAYSLRDAIDAGASVEQFADLAKTGRAATTANAKFLLLAQERLSSINP